MKFVAYSPSIEHTDKLIVDGAACGAGLQLSHWPGNTTSPEWKADLSVDIALRFVSSSRYNDYARDDTIVSNDHFDVDGLLATWIVIDPDQASRHRSATIAAAETGDFYELTTAAALRLQFIVQALADIELSPLRADLRARSASEQLQYLTEWCINRLPSLLYDHEPYRHLWEEPLADHRRCVDLANSTQMTVEHFPADSLTFIRTPRPLDRYTRHYISRSDRILEMETNGSERTFVLHYREKLWYDIVSHAVRPKHRLHELAKRLNELDTDEAVWAATDWSPALRRVTKGELAGGNRRKAAPHPSLLAPEVVLAEVRRELAELDARAESGR